jgi:hypothetical protein
MIENKYTKTIELVPNLDVLPKLIKAYEQAAEEDKTYHDHILNAHRNCLRDAVYFMYEANRTNEAAFWWKYLSDRYPNKPVLNDAKGASLPGTMTYEEYCIKKIQEDVGETDSKRVTGAIIGMIQHGYMELIADQDDRYLGYMLLAEKTYNTYEAQIPKSREEAIGLPPFKELVRIAQDQYLDTENPRLSPEARAVLRSKLNLKKETPPPKKEDVTSAGAAGTK